MKTYYIRTFGCQMNKADSERIAAYFAARGMRESKNINSADQVVINTCIVRQSAENRVYGLVRNLARQKESASSPKKIIVTGCLVGMAVRDKTGKMINRLREMMPIVDEFLPIEEVGFDQVPLRTGREHAWVPISNGCNNYCTFCVVPFTRGKEVSRPFQDIIKECRKLKEKGYKKITLVGQNVNSYGADLRLNSQTIKPVVVKHLGRYRIPTLFPCLLEEVVKLGFELVDFVSANPWDFSDELIEIVAKYPNISRVVHLPVQSGDDGVLKRMKRWYTAAEYLDLIKRIRKTIPKAFFTTDIIVGFPGETKKAFQNTVRLCQTAGFSKAYIARYSPRPGTEAFKLADDVPPSEKKRRWKVLENLINKQKPL